MSKSDKIWERQPNESEKAYEAFKIYLNLGDNRTAQAVADELQKSYTLIRRWKDKYSWKDRAIAYDNSLVEEARKKAKKDIEAMNKRHITQALKLQKIAVDGLIDLDISRLSPNMLLKYLSLGMELEKSSREAVLAENKNQSQNKSDKMNATDTEMLALSNLTEDELRKLALIGGENNVTDE